MQALEYGCGTGLLSFALQPQLGNITLADSSEGMLAVLNEKIAAHGITNMRAAKLDLVTDPLPPDRYALIYTLMTCHHIADTDGLLRSLYALLAPSGYLCIADLDAEDGSFHGQGFAGHNGFDRRELAARAEAAGFEKRGFHDRIQHDQGRRRGATRVPGLPDGGAEVGPSTRASPARPGTMPGLLVLPPPLP
jgi:ubiquinone/menaquinone biosynthesis C-methylase UbiE